MNLYEKYIGRIEAGDFIPVGNPDALKCTTCRTPTIHEDECASCQMKRRKREQAEQN